MSSQEDACDAYPRLLASKDGYCRVAGAFGGQSVMTRRACGAGQAEPSSSEAEGRDGDAIDMHRCTARTQAKAKAFGGNQRARGSMVVWLPAGPRC